MNQVVAIRSIVKKPSIDDFVDAIFLQIQRGTPPLLAAVVRFTR
jgi:hypothetical protein